MIESITTITERLQVLGPDDPNITAYDLASGKPFRIERITELTRHDPLEPSYRVHVSGHAGRDVAQYSTWFELADGHLRGLRDSDALPPPALLALLMPPGSGEPSRA